MEEDGRKDQKNPWHKCFHEKDWGTTQKTLEDHERRITQNEKDTGKFYEAVESVKLEIKGLRGDLKLTEEINGKQNKDIEGIQEEEREKIRSKAQNRGIVYGAILTFILILIADLIRAYTFL